MADILTCEQCEALAEKVIAIADESQAWAGMVDQDDDGTVRASLDGSFSIEQLERIITVLKGKQ